MQTGINSHKAHFVAGRAASKDYQDLSRALASKVAREVRFDGGSRALYATGGANWRQVPIGVVIPLDADDVIKTIGVCREFGAPILSRGGGTALAGQTTNVAVGIDFSKYMNRVLSIDVRKRTAVVQPGAILDDLRKAAEAFHLTFGPDPSTHDHCTLGGMIGNNSCGTHSVMAGRTADNVEELEILTVASIMGQKFVPGLLDQYLGRSGYKAQQTDKPVAPNHQDNLEKPVPGDVAAHGRIDDRASDSSPELWLSTHRAASIAIGLAGVALGPMSVRDLLRR
jgi:FAD/FMN-containing dehydrogenase